MSRLLNSASKPRIFAASAVFEKELPDEGEIQGAASADLSGLAALSHERVFGREGRAGGQPALFVRNQPSEAELRRGLHYRIGPLIEECGVASEQVMLPKMSAEPWRGHIPIGPRWIALSVVAHRTSLAPRSTL